MNYNIVQKDDHTWIIEDNGVRFFLLEGTEEALLIDCGMFVNNAKEIAESLTKLPFRLLLTHADRDHAGSMDEFDSFLMHPAEASNYYNTMKLNGNFIPVENGQVIDLGERPLQIIHIPGHTPGSIGILDVKNRVLISGDPVQTGEIYMFDVQREMHAYISSMKKLNAMKDQFDEIWPSHADLPVKPELIGQLQQAAEDILAGKCDGGTEECHGMMVKRIDAGMATFLIDAQ